MNTLELTAVLSEQKYPNLRFFIGELATSHSNNANEVFSWFEEDNTGPIQIDCTPWAIETVVAAADNLDLDENDEIELDNLLTAMIEANENDFDIMMYE